MKNLNTSYAITNETSNREQRNTAPQNGVCNDDEGGYADDISVHSWKCAELETMLNIMYEVFKEFSLQINIGKTETMIWNWEKSIDGEYFFYIRVYSGNKHLNNKFYKNKRGGSLNKLVIMKGLCPEGAGVQRQTNKNVGCLFLGGVTEGVLKRTVSSVTKKKKKRK